VKKHVLSWGRYPYHLQYPHLVFSRRDIPRIVESSFSPSSDRLLAYGMGRSYGDSCLSVSDQVFYMQGMNRIIDADWSNGILTAEAGITFDQLIQAILPRGWFLPVTPGTRFVTLGGAVANDVHGKNHHLMGTIGRHINQLLLYRSQEGLVECSHQKRQDLFAATIGGLGLTGIIVTVEIKLRRISASSINRKSRRFSCLDEFFSLSSDYDKSHEYSVAWIDCLASGKHTGRGRYIVGDHSDHGELGLVSKSRAAMPITPPFSLVNSLSLRLFNCFYYHRLPTKEVQDLVDYSTFFYPLDGVLNWNRVYGKRGFQQYQCVLPEKDGREAVRALLNEIRGSGAGSFLTVLKTFGALTSPGLLSFPIPGVTLALDFPQRDQQTANLFQRLDSIVDEAGGRLYPAKDAHISAKHFQKAYPAWEKVEAMRDPKLLSRFWKRVTGS
jgi:FAD/FMN-containing dehydrogenase